MSRLSRLDQFPAAFMHLTEVVALHKKEIVVPFADRTLAHNTRREWYLFRKLLRESLKHEAIAGPADNIIVSLREDNALYFHLRDQSSIALAIDAAIEAQAPNITFDDKPFGMQASPELIAELEEIEDPPPADTKPTAPDGRNLDYLKDID